MIFEVRNETREKFWSDFGAEQKWRAERKEWCLLVPLFLREREIDVWTIFSKRAKFFDGYRFDHDIVLVLGLFW